MRVLGDFENFYTVGVDGRLPTLVIAETPYLAKEKAAKLSATYAEAFELGRLVATKVDKRRII